jgi:Glycosyl transferase family 2
MTTWISAVFPTTNRPNHAVPRVGSILSNTDDFELFAVDLSDGAAEEALAVYAADRRFRYIRSSIRGASAAPHVGRDESVGSVIAITDDDCSVSTDWSHQIALLFKPEAGRVSIFELKGKRAAADIETHQPDYRHKLPPRTWREDWVRA